MSTRTTWREEEALWRLIQGFFSSAARDEGLTHCRGFSRQAMGDIAADIGFFAPSPPSMVDTRRRRHRGAKSGKLRSVGTSREPRDAGTGRDYSRRRRVRASNDDGLNE